MAKNSNINILQQERRKHKAKEIKKHKEQRSKEKLEKLQQQDPKRLERRVRELEEKQKLNNGRLIYNEQKLLANLKRDLELLRKNNGQNEDKNEDNNKEQIIEEKAEKVVELGKKSIFYDPEWNPRGIAPDGYDNVEYPLASPAEYSEDDSVLGIPLPASPPPKFFKIEGVQSVYESKDREVTAVTTSLIPSAVKRKRDDVI